MLTDAELAAIETRAAALPPPPWHAGRTVGRTVYVGDGPDDLVGVMDTRKLAAWVAAARTDVPRLCAEVRRLRAEVDAAAP